MVRVGVLGFLGVLGVWDAALKLLSFFLSPPAGERLLIQRCSIKTRGFTRKLKWGAAKITTLSTFHSYFQIFETDDFWISSLNGRETGPLWVFHSYFDFCILIYEILSFENNKENDLTQNCTRFFEATASKFSPKQHLYGKKMYKSDNKCKEKKAK